MNQSAETQDIEREVRDRYSRGAERVEPALCCPTDGYDPRYLDALPMEIIDKDYGCGDPARWAEPGDTVVDLGSGAGKACYILAQRVGAEGEVIGVDFNDDMLGLAKRYQDDVAERIGYRNTRFVKAKIQDLALDLDRAQRWLEANPVHGVDQLSAFEAECDRLRREEPLIPSGSVDLLVSNCVLNLVKPGDKARLFEEIARVLKPGGRAVISDIVCDEDPTPRILNDPELWSGCISGAYREDAFLEAFERAGFGGIEIVSRQAEPWQVVDGVEFRSVTVRAWKPESGPCLERHQAVVYKGPWKRVTDDEGHVYERGERMAVCDRTYRLLTDASGPYGGQMVGIEPDRLVPAEEAGAFDCASGAVRSPRETKGEAGSSRSLGQDGTDCCDDSGCC